MTFVSKNPMNHTNPEVGENAIIIASDKIQPGLEIIGFFKNRFTDKTYGKENYVIKDEQTGRDILIYGVTSLTREMSFYDIGHRLQLVYKGKSVNKDGKYRGKESHIWNVGMDETFIPTHDFIQSLQMEVHQRRQQVAQMTQNQGYGQPRPAPMAHQPQFNNPQGFSQNYPQQGQNMSQGQVQQPNAYPSQPGQFTPSPQGNKGLDPFG